MPAFFTFLRYELLMHVRSWRLWVCLGVLLLVGVPWSTVLSVKTNAAALDEIVAEDLGAVLFLGWLLVPVLILITVDTVARVRATGVHSILFTKPFSVLQHVAAGWCAVVILAMSIAAMVLGVRFAALRYMLGLPMHFEPYRDLFLLGAVPVIMCAVSISYWARTFFHHNVNAYIAAAALLYGLLVAAKTWTLPLLGWNPGYYEPLLRDYVAAIGRDLDWATYRYAFANSGLLSLLFLAISCYYLRRQEPQRGRKGSDIPGLSEFLASLRIDRRAGASAHFLLASTLVVGGFTASKSIERHREAAERYQRWAVELKRDIQSQPLEVPGVQVKRYSGALQIDARKQVTGDLALEMQNATTGPVSQIALKLPFGMQVERMALAEGNPLTFKRWGNIHVADLASPLAPGATATLSIAYAGVPLSLKIDDFDAHADKYPVTRQPLDEEGVVIQSNFLLVTEWLLPRSQVIKRRALENIVAETPRLFTADLELSLPCDLKVVAPHGQLTAQEDAGALKRLRFQIRWPRSRFLLAAGPYEAVERKYGPLAIRIFYLEPDRDVIEFALYESNETLERWGRILGPAQGPGYALVETPIPFPAEDGRPGPVLPVDEIERLRRYRPLFYEREREGTRAVYQFDALLSKTVAAAILTESFHPTRRIQPFAEALYPYLIGMVQRSEIGPGATAQPDLFRSAPANSSRGSGDRSHRYRGGWIGHGHHWHGPSISSRSGPPSDDSAKTVDSFLTAGQASKYKEPLIDRMADPGFDSWNAAYPWKMLHYLMDDEKFADFLQILMRESRNRLVRLDDIQSIASTVYGEPLDWFFNQWFRGRGVPKYVVSRADATMIENAKTRDVEYDLEVDVSNEGQGRMPVSVVVVTERDVFSRELWLDTATTETFSMRVADRPERVFIDPQGWVTQEEFRDEDNKPLGAARRRVRIIE